MLIDIHVHTSRTPGCSIDPGEAVRHAASLGLDGICFTDRDTLLGTKEIHALREESELAIFVGVELSTDHGRLLAFFPQPEKIPEPVDFLGPRPEAGWPIRNVVSRVRELGGVVVAAQPYDRRLERPMGDFVFTLDGISAIEGLAGTLHPNVNELAIEAAEHLALPSIGGSAATEDVSQIGTAATLFRDEIRDEAGLVGGLRSGQVWAVAAGKPPRFHGDRVAAMEREDRGRRGRGRRG